MNQCATTLDDRIDHLTFALNQRATRFISEWYRGVQIEKVGHTPVRFEEMWVTYLAAEIYNNADAALICILHNRGRSARILERQMYEAYIKARFYADNPELARLEYLAMPFRDQHLEDQSGREKTSPRYQSILAAVAAVSSQWPEVAAYVQSHNKEIDLRSMVGPHGDDDVDQEYAFRYRRLSQTPHGSVSGMHDVFDYRDDGNIGIWFDGRLPDPTFALHSMTVMLIGFLEIMNRVHHLGRDEEVRSLERESDEILRRLWPGDAKGAGGAMPQA